MNRITKKIASFKATPSSSLPLRPGAVQCVRNCSNCIPRQTGDDPERKEQLRAIASYDDLVKRNSTLIPEAQTLQYHIGQIDLLRCSLESAKERPTLFVFAAQAPEDIKYLNMVFDHVKLSKIQLVESLDSRDLAELISQQHMVAIYIKLGSGVANNYLVRGLEIQAYQTSEILINHLESVVNKALENLNFDIRIVPIVISKDQTSGGIFTLGSICVQIHEPYFLQGYVSRMKSRYVPIHLIQHIYHDIAKNAVILPSHIVAFLISYSDGIKFSGIVSHMDWFRKASIHTGMQIGFTGLSSHATEFGLLVVKNLIDRNGNVYSPKNRADLMAHGDVVTPLIAYIGIICRAIRKVHNDNCLAWPLTKFDSKIQVRVDKDKVFEMSELFAAELQHKIPSCRPCSDIQRTVQDAFVSMQTFGHYFKIEEPKVKAPSTRIWADDLEDDDFFFDGQELGDAYKSWVVLTQRPHRLDRLNIFMNAADDSLW